MRKHRSKIWDRLCSVNVSNHHRTPSNSWIIKRVWKRAKRNITPHPIIMFWTNYEKGSVWIINIIGLLIICRWRRATKWRVDDYIVAPVSRWVVIHGGTFALAMQRIKTLIISIIISIWRLRIIRGRRPIGGIGFKVTVAELSRLKLCQGVSITKSKFSFFFVGRKVAMFEGLKRKWKIRWRFKSIFFYVIQGSEIMCILK